MSENRRHLRFILIDRIEHWLFVASFTTLAITGLVQIFSRVELSKWTIALIGGIESVRNVHHLAATVMMFEAVYHIGAVGYKIFVRRSRMNMLPSLREVRKAWQAMRYNLGLGDTYPQQGRYTFAEKAEYWAVIWGTVIMAITGYMMWNPIATTKLLPGDFIPAAKAAHGGEALLAILAIIVWHLYHVHIRSFNKSMFNGYLSEEEMLDEHPLELADLKAGVIQQETDPKALTRRRRAFFSIFAVLTLVMLTGIYLFVSYEETAITTLPPAEQVVVFAPLTATPFPTPLPTRTRSVDAATTWNDGFADMFQEKCGLCHSGSSGLGGLDFGSYQNAKTGGDTGLAFLPGDPDASLLVRRQAIGDHPGQFTGEELALVRQWIEIGAPEE